MKDPDELFNLAEQSKYADQHAAMAAKLEAIDYTPPVKIPGGGITHNQLYGNN
ncbi:MAG: hypothetical protein GWO81_04370 [Verrucomicrobia bacterium]|nr:hypothetical protein [Verrucomicrobiota bacterium]